MTDKEQTNDSLKNSDENFNEKSAHKKEQIIIDGVDVAECFHRATNGLTNHKIPYCREFTNNCKDNPNCYYKQLQREKNLNKVNLQRSIDLNRELNNIEEQLYCKKIELQQAKSECLKLELQKIEFEEQCEELREKYKWYEHYKRAALYNKNLCDKKSDEIAYYKQLLKIL